MDRHARQYCNDSGAPARIVRCRPMPDIADMKTVCIPNAMIGAELQRLPHTQLQFFSLPGDSDASPNPVPIQFPLP
jgi:hypothetical protein